VADDFSQDIRNRTFKLACDLARVALRLTGPQGVRRLADQLLRAGTSIGANLEEAKAASSRKEFLYCVQIALREARETKYWLRICSELQLAPAAELSQLINEADQVCRILGAIVVNTKRRMATGHAAFAFCILNFALLISE
jgi:four helix bundle protein